MQKSQGDNVLVQAGLLPEVWSSVQVPWGSTSLEAKGACSIGSFTMVNGDMHGTSVIAVSPVCPQRQRRRSSWVAAAAAVAAVAAADVAGASLANDEWWGDLATATAERCAADQPWWLTSRATGTVCQSWCVVVRRRLQIVSRNACLKRRDIRLYRIGFTVQLTKYSTPATVHLTYKYYQLVACYNGIWQLLKSISVQWWHTAGTFTLCLVCVCLVQSFKVRNLTNEWTNNSLLGRPQNKPFCWQMLGSQVLNSLHIESTLTGYRTLNY